MPDQNGSMNGSGSAQGGGGQQSGRWGASQPGSTGYAGGGPGGLMDTPTNAYGKVQGTPQPGGNGGMAADTAGNVITNPEPDPGDGEILNAYDPVGPTRGDVSPSGIPIHTDLGAGQSAGLPPTFPPAQPTGSAATAAGPTPYDLYLSRGGRPLSDAQQAAAAQAQQALGTDYSHLSNPYSNIASAIQRGNTPDQIAQAVRGSYGGGSGYDLSQSHDGGQSAFNALRGGPGAAMGIYDNGSPQQVAAWRAAVSNNPLMAGKSWGDPATTATPVPGGGVAVGTPVNAGGGTTPPDRPGTGGPVTFTNSPSRGGGSIPGYDPGGPMNPGKGGTTIPGYDPGGPMNPSKGGGSTGYGGPWRPWAGGVGGVQNEGGGHTGKVPLGPGTSMGPGGTTGAGDPGSGGTQTPGPGRGGGGGYRPGGGRDVSENDSTSGGGGGGYGYEETTTKKWSPSGGSKGGGGQRQAAQYPWRGGQLS